MSRVSICREEATRLREQQDREYREAMEADRLAQNRQREEAAAREKAEEEARQAAELAAAVEMSKQLTREDTLRKLRATFSAHPEPEAGANVAAVRFQLPSGKKLSRRFVKTDTVQVRRKRVRSWVPSLLCYAVRFCSTVCAGIV
jgi:membrane protein involved in colicin uptake